MANSLDLNTWTQSWKAAVALHDVREISLLLQSLPPLETHEAMRDFLLISMDAEAMLCDMRQQLVNQRTLIISQFLP